MNTMQAPKAAKESIEKLSELLKCAKKYKDNPCTTRKGDKSCADQGLNADQMCSNCKSAWTDTSAIAGQTAQEALDLVRELRKEREAKQERAKYLESLADAPCSNEKTGGHCGDQNITFSQMCANCKKFWIEASTDQNMTPDEAIQLTKGFRNFLMKEMYDTGKVN